MEKTIINYFDMNHVEYLLINHAPVFTMEHTKDIEGLELEEGAKSLLLRADKKFILIVIPGHTRPNMKENEKNVWNKRSTFCNT